MKLFKSYPYKIRAVTYKKLSIDLKKYKPGEQVQYKTEGIIAGLQRKNFMTANYILFHFI